MDSQNLLAEVTMALESYRRMVPPGLYNFAPEVKDGEPTGRIVEAREDISSPVEQDKQEVHFGFWPLGFVPKEAARREGAPQWLKKYPVIPTVAKLDRAPAVFLQQLARHVNERISALSKP